MSEDIYFDLDSVHSEALEEGVKCLLFFEDEPLMDAKGAQAWILLAGQDSQRFQDVVKKRTTARTQKAWVVQMKGRPGSAQVAKQLAPTAEETEEDLMETRIACTLDWSPFKMHGEPFPCTPQNARVLYSTPRLRFIALQVDTFIGDRNHFLSIAKNGFVHTENGTSA